MKTIEERAIQASEGYDDHAYSAGLYMGYIEGAKEQNAIDKMEGEALLYTATKVAERTKKEMIDKACEWLEEHLYEEMFDLPFNNWIELFKKAMEEKQ